MKNILNLIISLTIITLVATAALSYVNDVTAEPRSKVATERLNANLKQILPKFSKIEDSVDGEFTIYKAYEEDKLVGTVIKGSAPGFGGPVEVLVSFNLNKTIRTIVVSNHTETPGLGTKVTDRKKERTIFDFFNELFSDEEKVDTNELPPNPYLDQYSDKDSTVVAGINLVKRPAKTDSEVSAVSGATVTSETVQVAVKKVCNFYNNLEK